ncbi:23S rRNA (uracil(1939)-C(5))-methyltransferase RlmD [Pseudoalteromonas mariniglutinosa]|uniref:23S rRNA (uracil(1939)-C(5))-methyltransferase RlmD n=1 Tax=Pseudoalteromonas mariniglutinosa TaxID=206042 RepID=UPI00384C5753
MAQFFHAKQKPQQQKMLTLSITGMDHQGRGIAKHNNKVYFVNGALPGEQVNALRVTDKARFANCEVKKVLSASEYRTVPFCRQYDQCGGCQLQHFDVAQQLVAKQTAVSQLFGKFAKTTILNWQAPLQGESQHYRRSARIAVMHDKSSKRMRVGYRQQGSKQLISIEQCDVLSVRFNAVFPLFDSLINHHHELKSISHLQLCEADNGCFIVIRHTKAISAEQKASVAEACLKHNWLLVWQSERQQIEQGSLPIPYYRLAHFQLELAFGLDNFIQVNPYINEAMLKQAIDWLDLNGDEQILDLFCGIGNFSLVLAKYAKYVIGVEGVSSAVAMATQNAHTNAITNTQFHCFDLTQTMQTADWYSQSLDVLVLDPSRTGAMAILEQLPLKQFKTILYVSCDPVTLARDSAIILQAGFSIKKIGLMNMFPHTGHIETMALFHRR